MRVLKTVAGSGNSRLLVKKLVLYIFQLINNHFCSIMVTIYYSTFNGSRDLHFILQATKGDVVFTPLRFSTNTRVAGRIKFTHFR